MLDPNDQVASFVLRHSSAALVFDRHYIDYCCQGHVPLALACTNGNIQLEGVLAELDAAFAEPDPESDPRTASTSSLINRALARQHRHLRATLTLIDHQARELAREYGHVYASVRALSIALEHLRVEMLAHLDHEEDTLFPAMLTAKTPESQAGLARMFDEHREFGDRFRRLRAQTNNYTAPVEANDNVKRLFRGVAELEAFVARHHHVENHVLLPRFR